MGLKSSLWPHQERGRDLIAGREATMLAWEMGAGKTLATIAAIDVLRPKRVLVVTPKSVVGVWPREIEKHGLGGYDVCAPETGGTKGKLGRIAPKLGLGRPLIVVTNHASAWRGDLGAKLRTTRWDLVVVDESHRAKQPSGRFSMWLCRLRHKAARRVGLTGTPMPHSPLDIYAQFRFLAPDVYGTSNTRFKARYAILGGYAVNDRPVQVVGYVNQEEMRAKFLSVADVVKIEDVLPDLPDEIHVERYVTLPPAARRAYGSMERNLIAELEAGTVTAANAMVKVGKLQQIAAGSVKDEMGRPISVHQEKTSALEESLADLPESAPVAVFCTFRHSLNEVIRLAGRLARPCDELHGGANTVGAKWEPKPGALAAIQYQSGGLGIDLTACRHVVLYDQTFNLGNYLQMIRRALRPGQKSDVTYIHLLAAGTVDEKIRTSLAKKQDVIATILEERKI